MTRRTIGRAAFVIAAGLLLLTGELARAVEAADGNAAVEQSKDAGKPLALTKESKTRTSKASRARKAKYTAVKASKPKAAEAKQAKGVSDKPHSIPATVANANAQMAGADARGEAAMSGQAPMEIAAADQLSELDKSLTITNADEPRRILTQLVLNDQPQSSLPVITPEPARPMAQVSARSGDAWAQSSLIGKIFIAFGGVLTLASAARMLVA